MTTSVYIVIFGPFFCRPTPLKTAAVAQWVIAIAPQAEGWVFESQSRQTR